MSPRLDIPVGFFAEAEKKLKDKTENDHWLFLLGVVRKEWQKRRDALEEGQERDWKVLTEMLRVVEDEEKKMRATTDPNAAALSRATTGIALGDKYAELTAVTGQQAAPMTPHGLFSSGAPVTMATMPRAALWSGDATVENNEQDRTSANGKRASTLAEQQVHEALASFATMMPGASQLQVARALRDLWDQKIDLAAAASTGRTDGLMPPETGLLSTLKEIISEMESMDSV